MQIEILQGKKPMARHAALIGGMVRAKRRLGKIDRRRRAIIEARAGGREGYYRLRDKIRRICHRVERRVTGLERS